MKKRIALQVGGHTIQIVVKKAKDELEKRLINKRSRSHPLSRFLRPLLEKRGIRAALGLSMVLILSASFQLTSGEVLGFNQEEELMVLRAKLTKIATEISVRFPLKDPVVSQNYHSFHRAIDFNGQKGDAVYPIMDGTVESISYSRFSYGNYIVVNHGSEIRSLYAHLSKINVSLSDAVNKNTAIGEVGSTGFSTGSHLHLEVSDHYRNFNPASILPL